MRVAAVDCGTNTIRLLIADIDAAAGSSVDVARELRYVRLGEGVDRTGRLADAAVERTLAAAEEYGALCRSHGVERIAVGATSAVRDAADPEAFLAGMADRLGARPSVLEGSEEARLSWLGAMRGLAGPDPGKLSDPYGAGAQHASDNSGGSGVPLPPDQLVVDIGGGSTELIRGDIAQLSAPYDARASHSADNFGGDGGLRAAVSLDIGSVRLTERHLTDDPPTPERIAAAAADADAALDTAADAIELARVGAVVGVAGSITTIAAQVLRATGGDASRVHHARLPIGDVVDVCTALAAAPVEERRAMPYMPAGRADVIGGGAVILQRLLRRLAPTLSLDRLVVSEHDILDGLAWSATESA